MKSLYLIFFLTLLLTSCSSYKQQNTRIVEYKVGQKIPHPTNTKIVLVGGCFDILHFGHIEFLRKARESGGNNSYLIVGLEPDISITKYKKRTPIHTQAERAHNLASIKFVDEVLLLPEMQGFKDYSQFVQDVFPNIIAVTADDPQIANKIKQAELVKGEVIIVTPNIRPFSSSNIIKHLSLKKNSI